MNTCKPVKIMDLRGTYKGGGGPDKTILNSAYHHNVEKVDVLVTYLRNQEDHEYSINTWAKRLGIKYIDVPDRRVVDFACVNKLKRIIDENDIQLIHSHDDKTLLYGWMLKIISPSIRIMYTCHSHAPYTRKNFDSISSYIRFRVRSKIQIFLMKRFNPPILTISSHTKQSLVEDGLKADYVQVLFNGIDTGVWHPLKGKPVLAQELSFSPDCPVVGTVARIAQKDKDLPTFYRVASKVAKQIPNVKFIVVGDGHGKELARAKNEVAALGLTNTIYFTGHRTDLFNIYASFDIFLMTSQSEGLPNTLLEAMAMGLPVVSTRVGGVPEVIISEKMGFLTSIGDVNELSAKLCLLLSNPEARARMGKAARLRVEEEFSFINRVRAMESYYQAFAWIL